MLIKNRYANLAILVISSVLFTGCLPSFEEVFLDTPIFTEEQVDTLNSKTLANEQEIIDGIELATSAGSSYSVANPFSPQTSLTTEECNNSESCSYRKETLNKSGSKFPARQVVYDWWVSKETFPETAEVCGIKFLDENSYRLDTFDNIDALRAADGYAVTHYLACGACSSLQDLAVYGTKDLTEMAKFCSRQGSTSSIKSCMQKIGFTTSCSEVWAYNGKHTAEACPWECVKAYGLFSLILGKEDAPPTDSNGNLNECLLCDEMMSGPGFQYGSGRTRRNTGIESEIERPEEQVYEVTHDYF